MERRFALLGLLEILALGAVLLAPAVLRPDEAERAFRSVVLEGRRVEGRLEPARGADVGTPIVRSGGEIGVVARDLGSGRFEVLLYPGSGDLEGPLSLELVPNPTGVAWALRELVTADVVEKFVEAASRARLQDSLADSFEVVSRTLQTRFPDVYAEHKERIEEDLGTLWRQELAGRAETLASRYVVPRVAEEVPFGDVGREVAGGTLERSPGDVARAVFGDEEAQEAVKREVFNQISRNPRLRLGLQSSAEKVWTDPGFRDEVAAAIRDVVEDDRLRHTAGGVLAESLEKSLPEIQEGLFAELQKLDRREIDLSEVVRQLALDEEGIGIRPALARVLRREILEKDLYVLEVREPAR